MILKKIGEFLKFGNASKKKEKAEEKEITKRSLIPVEIEEYREILKSLFERKEQIIKTESKYNNFFYSGCSSSANLIELANRSVQQTFVFAESVYEGLQDDKKLIEKLVYVPGHAKMISASMQKIVRDMESFIEHETLLETYPEIFETLDDAIVHAKYIMEHSDEFCPENVNLVIRCYLKFGACATLFSDLEKGKADVDIILQCMDYVVEARKAGLSVLKADPFFENQLGKIEDEKSQNLTNYRDSELNPVDEEGKEILDRYDNFIVDKEYILRHKDEVALQNIMLAYLSNEKLMSKFELAKNIENEVINQIKEDMELVSKLKKSSVEAESEAPEAE